MSNLILPKDIESKFQFITVAAQRAKQIQNGAKPRVEVRSRKPTRLSGGLRASSGHPARPARRVFKIPPPAHFVDSCSDVSRIRKILKTCRIVN